jgi:hypothetical protein
MAVVATDVRSYSCHMCGAGNAKRCNSCLSVAYCGKECQTRDWREEHKTICRQLAARLVTFTSILLLCVRTVGIYRTVGVNISTYERMGYFMNKRPKDQHLPTQWNLRGGR